MRPGFSVSEQSPTVPYPCSLCEADSEPGEPHCASCQKDVDLALKIADLTCIEQDELVRKYVTRTPERKIRMILLNMTEAERDHELESFECEKAGRS